jgi:hypothetical protein
MLTQLEKGKAFRVLHERKGAFIIPTLMRSADILVRNACGLESPRSLLAYTRC